jgi:hypothetical protein
MAMERLHMQASAGVTHSRELVISHAQESQRLHARKSSGVPFLLSAWAHFVLINLWRFSGNT